MEEFRKVEYYVSEEFDTGFDEIDNVNYDTAIALFQRYVDNIQYVNGKPFQVTEALIQDIDTQELSTVSIKQLKRFID